MLSIAIKSLLLLEVILNVLIIKRIIDYQIKSKYMVNNLEKTPNSIQDFHKFN